MAKTCDSLPMSMVGPFEQTLFLGCSIQSISTSLGWNEQQSTVTVVLVEDTCPSLPDKPKVYYPAPGLKYSWHDPDPGFTNPTIGAPVYFRIGSDPAWPVNKNDKAEGKGFEFAGVIQSWTKDFSPNGNPVYTVQIVDPRICLQNLEIIISDYAGSAHGQDFGGAWGSSQEGVYNLINAYGWLEWATTAPAGKGGTRGPCPQTIVLGANFGSPANGFGGSMNNNEGTPWHELRNAVQYLLSGRTGKAVGQSNTDPEGRFSPYGYAKFRGAKIGSIETGGDFVDTDESSNNADRHGLQGFGLFGKSNQGGYDDVRSYASLKGGDTKYIADYIVDIREVPFTPRWYRLAGPSMNLLDMISQICSEAGADYYVELLFTQFGQKIIKVRTVQRAIQPDVGGPNGIEKFVADVENVMSKNISRELRNEPTSVFIYGGYVQTVYQQVLENHIVQYWGKDSLGVHHVNCRINKGCSHPPVPFTAAHETGDWAIYLDVRPLNLNLTTPIPANYVWISETEIRLALGDFDAWYNYCLIYDENNGTPFGDYLRNTIGMQQTIEFPEDLLNAGMSKEALAAAFENLLAGGFSISFKVQDPSSTQDQDVKKVHEYIQNWADTFYGKQFLVQLPYVCYSYEQDSAQILFSDNPTNDGGYPPEDACRVLDMPWAEGATPEPLDFFSDDQNKILPFGRYYKDHTGAYPREGEWIAYTPGAVANCAPPISTVTSMYVKGSVEEDPIAYSVGGVTYATALWKTENPIENSGSRVNIDELFAGFSEIVIGSQKFDLTEILSLNFGIIFSPDGGGRTDAGAMSIAPKRRTPNMVAVPMKSNTTRYGPMSWNSAPGPVSFVADDGLVPWEYGGYGDAGDTPFSVVEKMWGAMVESARDKYSNMQCGERGSINFPGYPTRRLGEELRSSQKMMHELTLQSHAFNMIEGGGESLMFIETPNWDSTFGPNITNITINVGAEGFTTNYTLSTFSPSFGRWAKYNANRLKQSGQRRAEIMRMQREHNKLRRAVAAAQGRASAQIKDLKGRKPTKQAPEGGASVIAGTNTTMLPDGKGEGGTFTNPNSAHLTPRTLFHGNPSADAIPWASQGFMSQDGLFRAVANSSSTLPRYTSKNATNAKDQCGDIPHTRRESNPPFNGDKDYVPCIIDIDYLDPWAYPSKAKHDEDANDATNHSDINIFSHGAAAVVKQNIQEYSINNTFPSALRGIASKGPLLIHGWGYDIDGKPIPNEADDEVDASGGTFEDENLKDRFLSHYLRKPHTWPVGPVDLRWDRKRGVWTTPSEFKIIKGKTPEGAIAPGQTRTDCITALAGVGTRMGTTSNPVYDAAGNLVGTTGNIKVSNPTFQPTIPQDSEFYAIYDSIACTYYPIFGSGGSVSISGGSYCDYTSSFKACSGVSCIGFTSGLKVTDITDGIGTVVADHYIQDLDYCNWSASVGRTSPQFFNKLEVGTGLRGYYSDIEVGDNCAVRIDADHRISSTGTTCDGTDKTIDDQFFTHLSFGTGLGVYDRGDCKYEIYSCGSGGGGCITGASISCDVAVARGFCDKTGLVSSDDCIEGLLAGPGLDLWKITAEVPEKGSHYIESNLKITSGCVEYANPAMPMVNNVETIYLTCGLSGTPVSECEGKGGGGGSGICDIEIGLNPLACPGGWETVRYVHDICCSGAGLEVIYRHLQFSSCGLFSGVYGDEECSA